MIYCHWASFWAVHDEIVLFLFGKHMLRTIVYFLALFLPMGLIGQQPLDVGSIPALSTGARSEKLGTIEGKVLNAVTGGPLSSADLVLQKLGASQAPYSTSTDAAGHFAMRSIEPGRYKLAAERQGYVRTEYGARDYKQSGKVLTLQPGQQLTDISVSLLPNGVIVGRVVNESAEPFARAEVMAYGYTYSRGRQQLFPASSTMTNDMGEYRMDGLAPGRYYVSATYTPVSVAMESVDRSAGNSPEQVYAATFYPGANSFSLATLVTVAAGRQVPGIDMTLQKTTAVHVRGQVVSVAGAMKNVKLTLQLRDYGGIAFTGMKAAESGAQGRFVLRRVTPGNYILSADWAAGDRQFSARQALDVGTSNIDDVSIQITENATMGGQIIIDSKAPVDIGKPQLTLEPRDSAPTFMPTVRISDRGTFLFSNVARDKYIINVRGLAEDLYVKSMRFAGQEVLDTGLDLTRGAVEVPVEIVLSPSGGRINGVVVNSEMHAANAAQVVLIPEAREQERLYKISSTDQYGQFELRGVAPGDYRLFAFENIEPGDFQSPDFVKRYGSSGVKVTIRDGSREAQQLKLISAEDAAASTGAAN
jgi:hypothetical protein